MFTGLVEATGRMEAVETRGAEARLHIRPLAAFSDGPPGESIAVNGACLTVEKWSGGAFIAYASAETLARTNLGQLTPGAIVNLERALRLGDRMGGHLVSGHVDCWAEVADITREGESLAYRFTFPPEFGRQVVPKGSVALDGISLTVNDARLNFFTVNIIPQTRRETTVAEWKPGYRANMETDMIAKYVEQMLRPLGHTSVSGSAPSEELTEEFLRRHGF